MRSDEKAPILFLFRISNETSDMELKYGIVLTEAESFYLKYVLYYDDVSSIYMNQPSQITQQTEVPHSSGP